VLGKILVGEIFGMQMMCCRLKGQDSMTKFMILLNSAMDGQDSEKFPFSFFDRHSKYVEALLTANKRTDADGVITGVFCFLQVASVELLQALTVQRATEKVAFAKLKELAYIRQEIKNPLYGIMFTRNLMEDTDLSEDQKQFVETSAVCERQLRKILDDMDLESIEDGYSNNPFFPFPVESNMRLSLVLVNIISLLVKYGSLISMHFGQIIA
jgi:phytochrome B